MIFVTRSAAMSNVVSFSRALADPTRWRIVRLVMDDALCVCELADILEMPQSSVSSHVQIIRKAGLLESEKCEKWTYFQIHDDFRTLIGSLAEALRRARTTRFLKPTAPVDPAPRPAREQLLPRPQNCHLPTATS